MLRLVIVQALKIFAIVLVQILTNVLPTLTIALRIAPTLLEATSVSVTMDTSLILTITRAMVSVSFEVFGVYLVSQQTSMSVKRKQQSVTLMPHAAILMDRTTARVSMDTVEMEEIAQVRFHVLKCTLLYCLSGINLCVVGPTDCHNNATCLDRDGGYDCECDGGYSGNGTYCEGILVNHFTSANDESFLCRY